MNWEESRLRGWILIVPQVNHLAIVLIQFFNFEKQKLIMEGTMDDLP